MRLIGPLLGWHPEELPPGKHQDLLRNLREVFLEGDNRVTLDDVNCYDSMEDHKDKKHFLLDLVRDAGFQRLKDKRARKRQKVNDAVETAANEGGDINEYPSWLCQMTQWPATRE